VSNAVAVKRDKAILFSRVSIIVLLSTIFTTLESAYTNYLDEGIGLYGGLFHMTSLIQVFHIFILILTVVILQVTAFYPRRLLTKEYCTFLDMLYYTIDFNHKQILSSKIEQYKIIEYPLVVLFIVTGSLLLTSTSDLISIFLSIELQSYGLYILTSIHRNSELATSAGLTYFLLGGLSSCFILLGTSFLYSNSAITNLDGLYVVTSLNDVAFEFKSSFLLNNYYMSMPLLLLSVGFLFKISAAPFHFWSPDVYDAIPTVVTTFVAIVAKIAILIFLLEIVHYTGSFLFKNDFNWSIALLVSSLFSLIIGTIVGLTQTRIKRLLAYSTISHMGFILLAITINSLESVQSFIFYLIQYSLSNLNAFLLLLAMGYILYCMVSKIKQHQELTEIINSPIQLISQIKGFFYINPLLALSFAVTIFSFVGIPPLIGFFGKQMVLSAALDRGYVFLTLVAILTSVIGAVYYLNLIKQIFFYKSDYIFNSIFLNRYSYVRMFKRETSILKNTFLLKHNHILLSSYLTITISTLTLFILLFLINPEEIEKLTNILSLVIIKI